MNHHYADIRSRIDEEPTWWDEYAVPRYGDFKPDATADTYAKKCALALIECQQCRREFKVLFSWNGFPDLHAGTGLGPTKESDVAVLHYGDPPNVECCPAGATMNSVPIRVLEFWARDAGLLGMEWRRVPAFEIDIDHEWADLDDTTEER